MSDEHPPPFHGFGLSLVSSGIAHFNYTVQNYAYDHRGRMARKDISRGAAEPQSIFYTWDNWNIIRETHVSRLASRVTHNVWGLDLDGTLQGAGGVGSLLAVARDDGVFLPAYDANGNITEYIATNGEVVAHYDCSPFGETLVASGPLASTFTHRFSTKPWCADTGLSEYQMRKYRPDIGRWMSRDPIGASGDINQYEFAANHTISMIDPHGLQTFQPIETAQPAWRPSIINDPNLKCDPKQLDQLKEAVDAFCDAIGSKQCCEFAYDPVARSARAKAIEICANKSLIKDFHVGCAPDNYPYCKDIYGFKFPNSRRLIICPKGFSREGGVKCTLAHEIGHWLAADLGKEHPAGVFARCIDGCPAPIPGDDSSWPLPGESWEDLDKRLGITEPTRPSPILRE